MRKSDFSNFSNFSDFSEFSDFSILALLLVLFVGGCSQTPNAETASADQSQITQDLTATEDEADKYWRQTVGENLDLLSKKQYDKLEKTASALRKSKEKYASGRWKLDYFYRAFSEEPGKNAKEVTEADFQTRFQLINAWAAARPHNVTAKLALAGLYQKYAWFARGGGYADTVSEKGWKSMAERNASALKILKDVRVNPKKDPRVYYLLLQLAKDENYEKAQYAEIFDESIKLFPDYKTAYYSKVLDLQPRWGGEKGEWERFIKETADKAGGIEGDKFYAQMVWAVIYAHWYRTGNIFREFQLDYPRVKRGMEALRSAYPDSLEALSAYCSMASQAGDKITAVKLFNELGDRVDKEIWADEAAFKYWRDLASK